MKKQTTTAVGLNGCGIERVRLTAAQAQIAAIRAGVMPKVADNSAAQQEKRAV